MDYYRFIIFIFYNICLWIGESDSVLNLDPDTLALDPRCLTVTCPTPTCDSTVSDTGLRWVRYAWRDVTTNGTESFWCRGCQVCATMCPDYEHCAWASCGGRIQYEWVNNIWCPMCSQCDQTPRRCIDFQCQDITDFCTTPGLVEQRFVMSTYYCRGCQDCADRCPSFTCDTPANCSLGYKYNWYQNRLCAGCPECVSLAASLSLSHTLAFLVISTIISISIAN